MTDEESCLTYLDQDQFEFFSADLLERGNGFELVRKHAKDIWVVVLSLSDAIPVEYDAPGGLLLKLTSSKIANLWKRVLAVMGSLTAPSLRSDELPYLSCPRLTPREYEVLDRLARGMSDREIAEDLVVTEETARTYTKRLLRTLEVNNRVQAVLKGMRCGMVQI